MCRTYCAGILAFLSASIRATVADVLGASIGWTLMLQLPVILVGWTLGNMLGALAAYLRGGFDRILMPSSIFSAAFRRLAWRSFCW
jgi:peptide/nickel transport system permease protein